MSERSRGRTVCVLMLGAALGLAGCEKGARPCEGPDCASRGCEEIAAAFERVVADHQACQVDEDCAPVGGAASCECSPFLGAPDGVAVHVSAVAEAGELARRYLAESCGGAEDRVCDAGGIARVACQQGLCAAVEKRACQAPDAGDGGK